jgi:hypothetical protein
MQAMNLFYISMALILMKTAALNPPNFFTLRNILSSRAVVSTVLNEVNTEFVNENVLLYELTNQTHKLTIDLFYGITFIASLYLQYKYFTSIEKRLSGTQMFSNIQDKTRAFLFIIMIVFTKNIQNAI